MIDITTAYTVPDNFFSGDTWMEASLEPLTPEQKYLMSGILNQILIGPNFNKEQIHAINQYWENATDDEMILSTAYRAGLYSTDHTEEQILHHACNYITFFLCRGDGSEEIIQFEGEINHMTMLVKEAEWLLVSDVVSMEVYSHIIMRLFSENLNMEEFIENVLADEVGLLDDSIFLNLNIIGGVVVERLRGLNCDIYSELDRKKFEAELIAYEAEYRGSTLKEKVGKECLSTHLKDTHPDPLILDDVSSGSDDKIALMEASLEPLTPEQKYLMSSILNKILIGPNFNKDQIHAINQYWENVMEDEEVIMSSAFRAGLYSADENHEEFLFLACRFLVHSFGLGSELEQFQLKMKDMNPILRELTWLLAVEMFSTDVYCRVIKTLFTDNRGLGSKTSIYAVAGELGFLFLDQSIYKNLDMEGKIVNRRLMDLLSSSFEYVSEADVDGEKEGPTSVSVVKDCVMAAIDEREELKHHVFSLGLGDVESVSKEKEWEVRDLSERLRQGVGGGGWFLCGGIEDENSSLHDVVTVLSGSKMTFPTRVFMCDFLQEKLNELDSGAKKRIGFRVGEGHYGDSITPSLTLNAVKNSSTFSIAKVKEMMEVPFTVDADGLEAGDGNNCDLDLVMSDVISSIKETESFNKLQGHWNANTIGGIGGIATAIIFISAVLEAIVYLTTTMYEAKVNSNSNSRTSRGRGRGGGLNMPARIFYSLLLFLAASSNWFVDGADFLWKSGYKDNYGYKDYCDVGDVNDLISCVCLTGSTYTRPSSGAGSTGYSYYICYKDCDDYPFRAKGYCGQCEAGFFFGGYDECTSSQCDDPCTEDNLKPSSSCRCGITTYSKGIAQATYNFGYTCSHNANEVQGNCSPNYGSYNFGGGYSTCSECPAGTFSNQGDIVCSACPVGKYADTEGSSSCNSCPTGTYTDKTGTTECTLCPAGQYQDSEGQTECKMCQAGYYSSSSGSSTCTHCGAGEYSETTGATECSIADSGYYVGATNQFEPYTAQYPCPVGSYTDTTGQYHCVSCHDGYSTTGIASTKSSDCIYCEYGVDPYTFTCREAANLNDLCWDPSQLLSLNGSSVVDDLYYLVYDLADVGINSLINDTTSVIQGVADGTATIQDIQDVLSKLENGPTNWLDKVSSNMDYCVGAVSQQLYDQAQSDLYANTNMFQYQFGDNFAENRMEWIAKWKCSGATFGCMSVSSSSSSCPQAESCFSPVYQYYAALLSFPGGPPFGNNLHLHLSTGRYTPKYSPDFIESELMNNVQSLVNWDSAAESFLRYYDVIQQIEASEEATVNFIANVVDVTLQVENVSTSVSLNTSYAQGNLYYQQSEYNYNETYHYSEIVQFGPAYCPSEYEITADGIPDECTNYTVLVQKCQKEIKFDSFMSLITGTAELAAALVDPFAAEGSLEKFGKSFAAIGQITDFSETFAQQYFIRDEFWDPSTTLPPPPDMDANGAFDNETYADGSYQWYLSAQQSVSEALVSMSQARWESIYLENEQTLAPTLLDPPACSSWADDILAALTEYLANVKNMANYGSAMTAAAMNLDPTLGNIAINIATQEAIANANKEINGLVNKPNPSIETAPSSYQSVYEDIFYLTYTNVSKAILAYSPASSLAQKQYIAAKSICGFCVSYSYTNAGNLYDDTINGNTASCKDFGTLYLPTYETFQDTVSSFVEGTSASIANAPSLVDELNKNIIDFSENIQSNPKVFGQTRQDITGSQPHAIAIEFPLGINAMAYCEDGNTTSVPPYTPPQVYVDLTNGIVKFSLTASSDLWQQSLTPFVLEDANPLAINVQTYLKGVTSPDGQFIKMSVNPISPYFVYQDDSGVGTTYTLPPYIGSSGSSSFATFNSIQVQETCPGTDDTLVATNWMGDEQLSFCTDYSSSLQAPFEGIAAYDFLFPSLLTTWELQMNSDICDTHFYTIVNETLVLQVVFQYIASTSPSPADPNTCYQNCYDYNGVLPGQLWCDQPKCGDCPASLSYNGTDLTNGTEFCQCNVWNGNNGICTPTLALSNTYAVSLSGSSSRRHLRKKNKKGSDVEGTKSDKDNGAKSGKSMSDEEMMTSLNLQEALQTYLEECGAGGDNLVTSQVLVEVYDCHRHEKKNDHRCEFHVVFNEYEDDRDSKKALDECIDEKLQDEGILNGILQQTSSCGISVRDKSRGFKSAHHDNGCDDSSETSIFERV